MPPELLASVSMKKDHVVIELVAVGKRFNALSIGIGLRQDPVKQGFFARLFRLPPRLIATYLFSAHFKEGKFDAAKIGQTLNGLCNKHACRIEWHLLPLVYTAEAKRAPRLAHKTSKR